MINCKQFIECLDNGIIPPDHPQGSSPLGNDYHTSNDIVSHFTYRGEANSRGMWAIVDKIMASQLAGWIGKRKCLEVMAGAGWLAKALHECDISIIATDNDSWNGRHDKMKRIFKVIKLDAIKAVTKYKDADILIVSWPPYGDSEILKVCEKWGSDRPIIYIGENDGGCNAPKSFFEKLKEIDNHPEISLYSWNGLHDQVIIGNYNAGLTP